VQYRVIHLANYLPGAWEQLFNQLASEGWVYVGPLGDGSYILMYRKPVIP
jgi:hypothetical protein